MCNHRLHPLLATLPKVEHHIHIEGSLTPDLLFALSAANSVPLPSQPEFADPASLAARYAEFTSLDDFLHYYYVGFSVLRSAADFETLAFQYLARAATDGLRHAEIFFDPQAHVSRGVKLADVVAGLNAGRERAREELGVTSLLTPCFLRHLPLADADALLDDLLAGGYFLPGADDGRRAPPALAGLGICSSERGVPPPRDWAPIFRRAKAAVPGLRLTAHAGEEGPASAVVETLDTMGVERIDHGVRSAEDDALLERLARDKTMLTVCPLSNVRLRVAKSVSELPIRLFLSKGVRFSINSDDPAYFSGFLLDNYCAMQEAFGLTVDEWEGIATASVEGSWCDEQRKTELLDEVRVVVGDWRTKHFSSVV